MSTTNKIIGTIAVIGIILLGGAAVAWHRSQHLIPQYRLIVLDQPIRLEDGFSISHPFTVDVAAKYWVEVECRKTVPFDTLNQTLSKKLVAEYAITSGTERIAFGGTPKAPGMGYTNDHISCYLGTFDATPGVPYNLELHITADLPELASTGPAVKVSVDPLVFKEDVASAHSARAIGDLFALGGGICFLWIVFTLLFRRVNDILHNA
jgi:hypothetical protein